MKRWLFVSGVGAGFLCGFGAALFLSVSSSSGGPSAVDDKGSAKATQAVASVSETGVASYYADKYHGRPTASGEVFDMSQHTAAHRTLAFGTTVKVTSLENGRSVTVRINDRGPFVAGRVIDLSLAAAEELQMVRSGLARVKLEIVR
jgi:rare lipoprotein A